METSKKRTINVDDVEHSKKSKYVDDDEFGNSTRNILSEVDLPYEQKEKSEMVIESVADDSDDDDSSEEERRLIDLHLKSLETSNAQYYCSLLRKKIKKYFENEIEDPVLRHQIQHFDVTKLTDISGLFKDLTLRHPLNLIGWHGRLINVRKANQIFYNTTFHENSLKSYNSWWMPKLTEAEEAFANAKVFSEKHQNIEISWLLSIDDNTTHTIYLKRMFAGIQADNVKFSLLVMNYSDTYRIDVTDMFDVQYPGKIQTLHDKKINPVCFYGLENMMRSSKDAALQVEEYIKECSTIPVKYEIQPHGMSITTNKELLNYVHRNFIVHVDNNTFAYFVHVFMPSLSISNVTDISDLFNINMMFRSILKLQSDPEYKWKSGIDNIDILFKYWLENIKLDIKHCTVINRYLAEVPIGTTIDASLRTFYAIESAEAAFRNSPLYPIIIVEDATRTEPKKILKLNIQRMYECNEKWTYNRCLSYQQSFPDGNVKLASIFTFLTSPIYDSVRELQASFFLKGQNGLLMNWTGFVQAFYERVFALISGNTVNMIQEMYHWPRLHIRYLVHYYEANTPMSTSLDFWKVFSEGENHKSNGVTKDQSLLRYIMLHMHGIVPTKYNYTRFSFPKNGQIDKYFYISPVNHYGTISYFKHCYIFKIKEFMKENPMSHLQDFVNFKKPEENKVVQLTKRMLEINMHTLGNWQESFNQNSFQIHRIQEDEEYLEKILTFDKFYAPFYVDFIFDRNGNLMTDKTKQVIYFENFVHHFELSIFVSEFYNYQEDRTSKLPYPTYLVDFRPILKNNYAFIANQVWTKMRNKIDDIIDLLTNHTWKLIDLVSDPLIYTKSIYNHELIRYYITQDLPINSTCIEVDISCSECLNLSDRAQTLEIFNHKDRFPQDPDTVYLFAEGDPRDPKRKISILNRKDFLTRVGKKGGKGWRQRLRTRRR